MQKNWLSLSHVSWRLFTKLKNWAHWRAWFFHRFHWHTTSPNQQWYGRDGATRAEWRGAKFGNLSLWDLSGLLGFQYGLGSKHHFVVDKDKTGKTYFDLLRSAKILNLYGLYYICEYFVEHRQSEYFREITTELMVSRWINGVKVKEYTI